MPVLLLPSCQERNTVRCAHKGQHVPTCKVVGCWIGAKCQQGVHRLPVTLGCCIVQGSLAPAILLVCADVGSMRAQPCRRVCKGNLLVKMHAGGVG